MKITKKQLITGAAVAAALGAAAGILLAPKSGKKARKEVKSAAQDFYKYAAPKIKQLKGKSLAEYEALIKQAEESYGRIKKLTAADRKVLWRDAKKMWLHAKKKLTK